MSLELVSSVNIIFLSLELWWHCALVQRKVGSESPLANSLDSNENDGMLDDILCQMAVSTWPSVIVLRGSSDVHPASD